MTITMEQRTFEKLCFLLVKRWLKHCSMLTSMRPRESIRGIITLSKWTLIAWRSTTFRTVVERKLPKKFIFRSCRTVTEILTNLYIWLLWSGAQAYKLSASYCEWKSCRKMCTLLAQRTPNVITTERMSCNERVVGIWSKHFLKDHHSWWNQVLRIRHENETISKTIKGFKRPMPFQKAHVKSNV